MIYLKLLIMEHQRRVTRQGQDQGTLKVGTGQNGLFCFFFSAPVQDQGRTGACKK